MASKTQAKRKSKSSPVTTSVEQVTQSIQIIRGQKVLLDSDLAALYGVETRVLLQSVRRNIERFPEDFMLQLSQEEWTALRSQFVTLNDIKLRSQFVTSRQGGRRYLPYAFTEQGVAMLSSVLKSERAIAVNIEIMRAFVRMRELLASNKELAHQLKTLESRVARKFAIHDQAIADILKTIRELMSPPVVPKRSIGFVELEERKR